MGGQERNEVNHVTGRAGLILQAEMYLKGLCQLESMRSEVMQITFNCQNSIVFNA